MKIKKCLTGIAVQTDLPGKPVTSPLIIYDLGLAPGVKLGTFPTGIGTHLYRLV
jgi:hypothetical protein